MNYATHRPFPKVPLTDISRVTACFSGKYTHMQESKKYPPTTITTNNGAR